MTATFLPQGRSVAVIFCSSIRAPGKTPGL